MYLCINQAASKVGSIVIAAPAAIGPYCTSMEPQKEDIYTVTGLAVTRVKRKA